MDKAPLFSVIIPVYNVEKYLSECVESVISQKCTDFEIVLVDDASPDNCPMLCDSFAKKDNRIRVIHKENGGAAAARLDGAKQAFGQYVVFLDGDDRFTADCLERLKDALSEAQAEIVCFGMLYDNGKEYTPKPLTYREGYYSKDDIVKEIFPLLIQRNDAAYFTPSLCGKAVKRELFISNSLANCNCTIGEDGACVIPAVFKSESLIILKDCLYLYRFNQQSATKNKNVIPWQCPEIIYNHILEHINVDLYDFRQQLNRKLAHDLFNTVLSRFYAKQSYRKTVKEIKTHLAMPLYNEAIKNCDFSGSIMGVFMKTALKYRIMLPIYLYSKR